MLTNPIWVIKTRLQLQRVSSLKAAGSKAAQRAVRGSSAYRGFAHAVRQIAKEEGLKGFYRGLFPSLLLVASHSFYIDSSTVINGQAQCSVICFACETLVNVQVSHGAIQFMVYEELKKVASGPLMRANGDTQPLTGLEVSFMGAASKLAASIVTYPSQVWQHSMRHRNKLSFCRMVQ